MMTPGSSPSPALIWVMRCLGVAPLVPKATMWVLRAEAPADVPATMAPRRWRSAKARPSGVPPITLESRSWLPPVMKMPVASSTASRIPGSDASSRLSGRRPRTSVTPREWNRWRYRSVASSPSEEAVEMTAMRASAPPASVTNRVRICRCRSLSSAPPMTSRCPARGVAGLVASAMSRASIPNGARSTAGRASYPARMADRIDADELRTEARDYYEVLGADPSATAAELRAAFRTAVLRHHPDRSASGGMATRRTAVLNRAWRELRDPLRRIHYDRALERGSAATLDWPLERSEEHTSELQSPWHL